MMRISRVLSGLLLLCGAAVPALAGVSCGSGSNNSGFAPDAGGDASTDGGPGADATTEGGSLFDQISSCTTGQACGDGGVCAGNVCCTPSQACGAACCTAGSVCSFQACVVPGATCNDSSDCKANEYCEYSLGNNSTDAGVPPDAACQGGAALLNGKCLPKPPTCAADAGTPDSGALDCLEQCSFHPTGTFNPALKASWGGVLVSPFNTDVMMAPIVVVLQDTNCDGKVDAKDVPDIVFTSFTGGDYQHSGTLHAVRYVGGATLVEQWSAAGMNPAGQLAGGNIDGLPGNEVIACGDGTGTHAFHGDGTLYWTSPASCSMPSIADIDGDGHPEVIVEGGILDGTTGALKHAFVPALDTSFIVSDLDGDGVLDVITADRGYHADGTLFIDTKLGGTWPAIADFDHDGKREVVLIDYTTHALSLWRYDTTQPGNFVVVRAPVDMNAAFPTNHCPGGSAGSTSGGGPPTVADFNGDGIPDVGLAGGIAYVAFDGAKLMTASVAGPQTILWSVTTTDCSSAATGSSVFDFQGNGLAEAVYSDEEYLRIYAGASGNVIWKTCNTTGTLIEYPVIADIDNDGHADIVVVSNAYASGNAEYQCNDGTNIAQAGVRVFSDANNTWVRTPPVWNEHAYHITNVTPDGVIPQHELPNYEQPGLDNFRQNKQPGSEFAAPDGIVSVASACPGPTALVATVRNIGQAALPAGVSIGFYEGAPPGKLLGHATTTILLYPAEALDVVLPLASPDHALTSGASPVYAVFDDGGPAHPSWTECRTDNNTSAPTSAACQGAQ